MSGIVITDDSDRIFLCQQIANAKPGTLVTMLIDPATEAQKRKLRAMCGEVAKQVQHQGRFYHADQWKALFMQACGQEVEMMPSLDGSTFVPYNGKSSRMNRPDMNQLISFIDAWGTQNGVAFKEAD